MLHLVLDTHQSVLEKWKTKPLQEVFCIVFLIMDHKSLFFNLYVSVFFHRSWPLKWYGLEERCCSDGVYGASLGT